MLPNEAGDDVLLSASSVEAVYVVSASIVLLLGGDELLLASFLAVEGDPLVPSKCRVEPPGDAELSSVCPLAGVESSLWPVEEKPAVVSRFSLVLSVAELRVDG